MDLPFDIRIAQVWIFLSTWFMAEIFLFVAIRIANRFHLHDAPTEERKIHQTPTPTIGGIPVFCAFALGIILAQEGLDQMQPLLLGSFACMVLGLIDDLKPISAVVKLIILFIVT
ncbi:MAG: hypothetical protein HQL32_16590, partial [Planctomycetes bacterium]|nr:hypothetical protein [Planctomycetota bacterium]